MNDGQNADRSAIFRGKMKKVKGEKMIVELGVGFLAVCAVGYAIHWHKERVKWARLRGEWLERLKKLDEKIREGR